MFFLTRHQRQVGSDREFTVKEKDTKHFGLILVQIGMADLVAGPPRPPKELGVFQPGRILAPRDK